MTLPLDYQIWITGLTVLILVLWAAAVVFTGWHTRRLRLPPAEALLWTAASALLPLGGFLAYLLVVALPRRRPSRFPVQPSVPLSGRETLLRPQAPPRRGLETLDVSERALATVVSPKNGDADPARPASYIITVSAGPHVGQIFMIARLPAWIGRGEQAAVSLDGDLGVSRQHAELYEAQGALRIRDLQSTYGTQVNGRLTYDQPLASGDRIRVGLTELEVAVEGSASQQARL